MAEWHASERERLKGETVFPSISTCILVIHNTNPVILGIRVISGIVKLRTPLALSDGRG